MEKNDADLRFAFGVTAMTTDRNASSGRRQSALKFGLDYFSLVLHKYCVDTHLLERKEEKNIENEKKSYTRATKSFRYYEVVLSVGVATFLLS